MLPLPFETQLDILTRGVADVLPFEEFKTRLKRSIDENKPLVVKFGADPSAPDLHLGHTVPLRKLRQFQDLGHRVVFLIGDFTGMIGDPTGRNGARKRLTAEEVAANAETYKAQIFRVLDPAKTELVFNSAWFSRFDFARVLDLTARYTVARLLERDDFAKRHKEGKPIHLIEFLYPLVQGYDSVELACDLELGGTDQKFNLLVGRDLQAEYGLPERQIVMMTPLLEGTDGVEKMSKSKGNAIGIAESAESMFGKIMSIPDGMILRWFELVTDVPMEEIAKLGERMAVGENPRSFKVLLGKTVVGLFHGPDAAERAAAAFDAVFRAKAAPEDMPELRLDAPTPLLDLLVAGGAAVSKSEARRLVRQGAVSVDGKRVADETAVMEPGSSRIVKAGKRRYFRIMRDEP